MPGHGQELRVEVTITVANAILQPELCRAGVGLAEVSGGSCHINKQEQDFKASKFLT